MQIETKEQRHQVVAPGPRDLSPTPPRAPNVPAAVPPERASGHQQDGFEEASPGDPYGLGRPQAAAAPAAASQPLAATHRDIETNVMALGGSVGEGGTNDPADVRRVQRRLSEIGLLPAGQVSGTYDDATREAISRFQRERGTDDIAQIQQDSRDPAFPTQRGGEHLTPERIAPHDATHQALANAWPRTVNGRLMTEEQAYNYLANAIQQDPGIASFDRDRVHVVGVRGYQGGGPHQNPGVRHSNNQYNDELFVLSRNPDGSPRVRSFVATTDPGAAGNVTDATRDQIPILEAHQRIPYRHGLGAVRFDTRGSGPTGRLRVDRGGHSVERDAPGIAIHSGNETADGRVFADSQGCQVVHGSWYPAFHQEIGRGLQAQRQRVAAGGRELGHAPGEFQYEILDGRQLPAPAGPPRRRPADACVSPRPGVYVSRASN
ncbi:MAG: peptidoglycan-binding protein [Candidatus Schekmanbacteria bacterium]|nr:peptidoglycan-binding protein [Candidatus Schekmanbacteria bacterium]